MIRRKNTDKKTIQDIPADEFISAFVEHLKKSKKEFPIKNGYYLKTDCSREVSPNDEIGPIQDMLVWLGISIYDLVLDLELFNKFLENREDLETKENYIPKGLERLSDIFYINLSRLSC